MVVHNNQSIKLELVHKQHIVEMVQTSRNIEHMEKVLIQPRIVRFTHHISIVQQLLVRNIQSIKQLKECIIGRFQFSLRRNIGHMEMALLIQH